MPRWRLITWLLIGWTLAMAVWLVLYQPEDVTCGPEIYRDCQIGLKVNTGLGRPGIVLLWSLGVLALAMTWLTRHRPRAKQEQHASPRYAPWPSRTAPAPRDAGPQDAVRTPMPASLRGAVKLAAALFPLAVVVGFVTSDRTIRREAPAATQDVRVRIVSTVLDRAVTPSGRRRERARLSVGVRVTNRGKRTIADVEPVLLAGARVRPDPRARDATGSLLRPIRPGFTAGGLLRFETGGAVTRRLVDSRRAQLQIAGQTGTITFIVRRLPSASRRR